MTPEQIPVLAAYVNGQTTLKQYLIQGADNQATAALNAAAAPDYWVFKSSVSEVEVTSTPSADGTVFLWTALIARSVGEQFGWSRMFSFTGSVDPSKANIRKAFLDIFSGAQNNAPEQRAHLLAMARRKATVAEKQFTVATVGGTGTRGGTGNPDTLTFEGAVTDADMSAVALSLGLR